MIKSINELFGIDFDPKAFVASSNTVVTDRVTRNINQKIYDLKKCSQSVSERYPTVSPPKATDLSQIKAKFSKYSTTSDLSHDYFTDKEIRTMCYFANQIAKSTDEYQLLIFIIKKRWRQSYLNGLMFCLLYNWQTLEHDIVSSKFRSFIIDQLANYQGQRSHLLKMKSNMKYFMDGGALALGRFVVSNKKSVLEAPACIGLKQRELGYSYFSKIIQYYFRNQSSTNLSELEVALTQHSNAVTSKIVLSDKIIKADDDSKELQESLALKQLAIKLVGDPFVNANWNTVGVGHDYEAQVTQAHTIMKKWLIKSYLNVAFERLINDPDRKRFWLRYTDYIDDIKIVGNLQHKSIISSNPDLKEALTNCFCLLISNTISNTCSVAIRIKNHYFFEFSEMGNACYVYNDDRKMKMLSHGIRKVNDLKDTGMNVLVEQYSGYYHYNDCGRVLHSGNWQGRLRKWFQSKMNIYV